jgi:hypothetical protein
VGEQPELAGQLRLRRQDALEQVLSISVLERNWGGPEGCMFGTSQPRERPVGDRRGAAVRAFQLYCSTSGYTLLPLVGRHVP